MAANAPKPLDLSQLAKPPTEDHYSEAIKTIPAEIVAFVKDGYVRTKGLKQGVWLTRELASAEDVIQVIDLAGRYARHHGMSFRHHTKETTGNKLVYRVRDKAKKGIDERTEPGEKPGPGSVSKA